MNVFFLFNNKNIKKYFKFVFSCFLYCSFFLAFVVDSLKFRDCDLKYSGIFSSHFLDVLSQRAPLTFTNACHFTSMIVCRPSYIISSKLRYKLHRGCFQISL